MSAGTALIVGGGVAGLSAAWWLGRGGWQCIVLERAETLRNNGYMIGVSGPGHDVARRMGLMEALQARHRPINENVYLGRDGRLLWRVKYHELLAGLDWIMLARTDLVDVLYDSVRDGADIRFGVSVAEIEQDAAGVEATLTDGSRCRADLLIGADGVHSAVRRMVFGPDGDFVRPLGYRCASFQLPDSLGLGHDFLSFAEPRRLTEIYTLAEGRIATLYAWRSQTAAPVPPAEARTVLRQAYDGAHPTVLRYLDELPADASLYFDNLELVEMPAWSTGRVLLLGDAAHCLTLISGQGAGMAMTSAWMLAEALGETDVDAALKLHEARLRPSIARLQARSRKLAPLFIPATPRSFALRNAVLRHAPRRLLAWYLARSTRTEVRCAFSGWPGPSDRS